MNRLPSELRHAIARTLIDELLDFGLPSFYASKALPEDYHGLCRLARQASETLRDLSFTSRDWTLVAAPLYRSLLVGVRHVAIPCPATVEIAIVASEWTSGQASPRAARALSKCCNVRTLILPDESVLALLDPALPLCTTVVMAHGRDECAGKLFAQMPALRTLRTRALSSPSRMRGDAIVPRHLAELSLSCRPDIARLVGACPCLVRLRIVGGCQAVVRRVLGVASVTLRHLVLASWPGRKCDANSAPMSAVADLQVDLLEMMTRLSTLTVIIGADNLWHRDGCASNGACARSNLAEAMSQLNGSPSHAALGCAVTVRDCTLGARHGAFEGGCQYQLRDAAHGLSAIYETAEPQVLDRACPASADAAGTDIVNRQPYSPGRDPRAGSLGGHGGVCTRSRARARSRGASI